MSEAGLDLLRFSVDPWDPSYGVSAEVDTLETSSADVAIDLEVPAAAWAPIDPAPSAAPPESIVFIDGVRRVEGRVWLEAGDGDVHAGICASFAAGAVRCDGVARFAAAEVGRGLFSASPVARDIRTRYGDFPALMAAGASPEALSLALQQRMGATEVAIAERVGREQGADLLVVDGPLRGRAHLPSSIGFVKTHEVTYLPAEQNRVVAALGAGQRTPVFTIGTSWSRHSWYLRLPGDAGSPWAGIVRCECSADLAPPAVIALANSATGALPRFASESHKDPRAPQNLYPIAALERELRRRLGDQQLVYRGLRAAAVRTRTA
jgi:hypothetical protein